jgi:predicted DNA-binding protein (UPF0278 family)
MGYNTRMTREIKITPVLNGFVCKVGCQTVVFNTVLDLIQNIERYYRNPDAVEKEFIANAVNKMNDGIGVAEPCISETACDSAPVRAETCESPRPIRTIR